MCECRLFTVNNGAAVVNINYYNAWKINIVTLYRYTSQLLEDSNDIPVVVLPLHIGNNIVGRSIGLQYAQLDDVGPGLEEMESHLQYLWLSWVAVAD